MFAYCGNNPVIHCDPSGELFLLIGVIDNLINAIYYEFSDGESSLSPNSYSDGSGTTVTRWDKLDYAKQETQEDHYNINAWRYYNEYTFHEYGWYITGWAKDKDITGVSSLADRFENADVYPDSWDDRWYVNVFTVLFGIFGA